MPRRPWFCPGYVVLVYGIDRLVIRRHDVITDGLLIMLGVLPFAVCLAANNAAITGNPFQVTSTWASPIEFFPPGEAAGTGLLIPPALRGLYWLGMLAQFGGLPVAVLAAIALVAKIRQRTCRFYDFLFPAVIAFYFFVPFSGGHQYGPRYWFWAWPLSVLTVTSGLVDEAGHLRIGRWRIVFEGFTASSLVYAAGAFCVLLVTTHAYIEARREVFAGPQPESRAIVLVPQRSLYIWPWQGSKGILAPTLDFTRNDIDFDARVLYGRADLPNAVVRACGLSGREVFRWEEPGRLVRVVCP